MTTRVETSEAEEAAARALEADALVGTKIHKYEIVRVIGRGGMGTVYEALNTTIGKRVAMKFVDAEMARNKDAVARFQREAQAASAVESAHIVEIFDSGETDEGVPFIVMELMRGEDLGHRIKRCGRLELPEAAHITAQILRGLHRAHAAGIVHRDLKPDNVFLVDRDDDQNFAKILDFGISKVQRIGQVPVSTLTRQGTVLGTPFYMSPEQAQALADIDGRTDLWSVGAIFYECLTGRPPYGGATYEQVIINICMKDAEDVRMHNPAVTEPLAQLVAKALCRDRDGRFATAREFLDALVSATGGLVSSRPGSRSSADELLAAMTPRASQTISNPDGVGQETGFEPTVEMHPAGTSKVGWSTSGRLSAARGRRRYVVVGAVALALGAVAGLVFVRSQPTSTPAPAAAAAPAATSEEVALTLSVKGTRARFTIDGKPLAGGVIRGRDGDKRHVVVEPEGGSPFETDVVLQSGSSTLVLGAPTVTPIAPSATALVQVSPSGEPVASAEPVKTAQRPPRVGPGPVRGPKTTQAPVAPTAKAGVGAGVVMKAE